MTSHARDRAISVAAEDQLGRASFASRVTDALISRGDGQAFGVVIGVTGPWGSGKSSVLNLVQEDIEARYPDVATVRFDPWLISGQHDLIQSFLAELIATLRDEPKHARNFRKFIDELERYAAHLEPIGNALSKVLGLSLGSAGKGMAQGLATMVRGDTSLTALRRRLEAQIKASNSSIIVLIDEVDRIEDAEVRAVAQLVRAVGDFAGVSYVLAYDPERVAQALGEGADEATRASHGRAYLEKIVQLPLAMPVALPHELRAMLDSGIVEASKSLGLDPPLTEDRRYRLIAEAITPGLLSTPRDLKRLTSMFLPLAAMVQGEVDLVDVLGFSALAIKAPNVVDRMRQDPDRFVDDPISHIEATRRDQAMRSFGPLADVLPLNEPHAAPLLHRLFPATRGEHRDVGHIGCISFRDTLLTLLRSGIVPDRVEFGPAHEIIYSIGDHSEKLLRVALEQGELGATMAAIASAYPEQLEREDIGYWDAVARLVNDTSISEELRFGVLRETALTAASMLANAVAGRSEFREKAIRIVQFLLERGDAVLTPLWIRGHQALHHRAQSKELQGPFGGFLIDQEVQNYAQRFRESFSKDIAAGKLDRFVTIDPLLIITSNASAWSAHRKAFADQLPRTIGPVATLLHVDEARGAWAESDLSSLGDLNMLIATAKQALEAGDGLSLVQRKALQWLVRREQSPASA